MATRRRSRASRSSAGAGDPRDRARRARIELGRPPGAPRPRRRVAHRRPGSRHTRRAHPRRGQGLLVGWELRAALRPHRRLRGPHARHARGARHRLQRASTAPSPSCRPCTGPRSVPASRWRCSPTSRSSAGPHGSSTVTPRSASPPVTTPRSAGRCCAGWPRRSTTCSPARRSPARKPNASGSCRCASTTTRCSTPRVDVAAHARDRRAERDPLDEVGAQQLVPRDGPELRRVAGDGVLRLRRSRRRGGARRGARQARSRTSPGRRASRRAPLLSSS